MAAIKDHPLRYMLANELHARPFPSVAAPARAAYLALKPAENAAARDRDADRAHLIAPSRPVRGGPSAARRDALFRHDRQALPEVGDAIPSS